MALQTGENEQAMRKILDMTRLMSIVILFIHCYYYLYAAFELWQLTIPLTDRLAWQHSQYGTIQQFP